MMKMIVKAKPDLETTNVPKNKIRKMLHRFVTKNRFDIFIMGCIVLNMIQMACTFEGSTTEYNWVLELINYVFTAIFGLEATLKLIGFGMSYFKNSWNRFDFIVVIASFIDIIMSTLD